MSDSDTILVVIDPTTTRQDALEQAAVLAKSFDMQLELFICTHDDSLKHYREILGEEVLETSKMLTLDKLSGILEAMAEPLRVQNIKVTCDVSWDWPLNEGIIRKAMASRPFLIVKDTHSHSKFTRAILRNTDWSLIKNCPFPILFIKQAGNLKQPLIISCVNPIDETEKDIDRKILKLGETLANKLDGRHKVFHTYKPITNVFASLTEKDSGPSLEEQNDAILKMHQNRIEVLVDECNIDQINVIFEHGDASELLPRVVEEKKADLVIMGSQTKSGFKYAFVGSTAEAVLDELSCNMLVLKPDSFKTSVHKEPMPDYPPVIWPV